jgi:predicted RNA-binding Zn-ribbon protein involved in translation (DUF1610 family)
LCEPKFDETIELAENAMLKHRLDLFDQWDFEKNDKLGLDIYKITKGSHKIAWWECPKCGSAYDTEINKRVASNQNCPYCGGQRVNHTNSLATLNPELALEWQSTLNGDLTPHDVTLGSNQKVWWVCSKFGDHEWEATIYNRATNNSGCSICCSRKVLKGYNDMWTTNPELALILLNPEDGYEYTQMSNKKVDWKCPDCGETIKNKIISDVNTKGVSCPKCSDGIKFPEKFMCNLLKESGIEFEYDTTKQWSQNKRYDFYIPKYNWIIETHGGQHYGEGFVGIGERARSYKEEKENDEFKQYLANANGINKYIIIDARYSTVEHMKNSILNSDIMTIIPEINFGEIGQLASKSLVKTVCDLWNSGYYSLINIAEEVKLNHGTVIKYLKRGTEIGWCDYTKKEAIRTYGTRDGGWRRKITIQLSIDNDFIAEWSSATLAAHSLNINGSKISSCCRGKKKTTGGFKWMYKEDYDKLNKSS